MPHYLSDAELQRTAPAEVATYRSPVPTQSVVNMNALRRRSPRPCASAP